ncbi:ethanolamine ammonia-lyase reactivating factor EutA [Tessaracoccus caeni]|uniref:ethanolamine ammonia-lyase reactivating factor EutA n=1 Tax=Tessaracoccus caeni TaxID=3031239 RepID=UPI0023DADA5D|nr:ethanolamine ammonia-lyase reactivating factor EutA [Tessaracoccus caeni]MDF1490074.1 ethanolamine ammonia-lyase reactivating factor EutA [Tessaracoccus caeni]
MASQDVLSVGIDVGTTTSQLVLSRLTITNQHRPGLVPRLDIDDREVLFESDPKLTPLAAPDLVDVDKLVGLIRREYELAGVDPKQVETGAVIITGETARTKNAEAILHGLSDLAGDFVVTVAGPNLESSIAARGSGAADWSRHRYASVVNVDVGGGSSNAALFRSGKHLSSSAAMVGGRQAVIDPQTGILTHLAPPGKLIVERLGIRDVEIGRRPSLAGLRALTDAMAEVIVDLVLGLPCRFGDAVQLSPPLEVEGTVAAYFVSGGVGALYYDDAPAETLEQVIRYGDVGPLLATSLRENTRWRELHVVEPAQTLRATVLGAASQQVTLSGSTIWAEPQQLPMRNLPVIEPKLPDHLESTQVLAALRTAMQRWDREERGGFVLSLVLPERITYAQLRELAMGVASFAEEELAPGEPVVLVTEQDYAQILGQTLKGLANDLPLVVVDQVGLGEGDFIDIGEPMFDGRVVPVSVKTLVFYQ